MTASLPLALARGAVRLGERAFAALDRAVLARRVSRTGHANPRVARLVGRVGFAAHTHRATTPNLRRWLAGDRDLFPAFVQVQTINRCQAACEFCPYPDTVATQPLRVMDDDLYGRIADQCAAEPGLISFVPMAKNEPLLDADLPARIARFTRVRQPHQIAEIVTNGVGLTAGRVRALTAAGLDLLTVSVNAADAATFGRVMRGLSWERVTAHLDVLAAADLPTLNVYVRFVRNLSNRHDLRAFRRRWRRLNLFGFDINNRAGAVRDFDRMRLARTRLSSWLRYLVTSTVWPACPYPFAHLHVLANGDVPLCDNDWFDREILGNARDTPLRAIFNSPRLNEIRALQLAGRYDEIPSCRDCSFHHEFWRPPRQPSSDRRVSTRVATS